MQLKVDIVTLPPLAEAEQTAMLDLRSIETGGQGHFPPFLGYHTGFPDESLFTVNKSARVFMATDLVEPFFHPDEHPCTCVAPVPPQPSPQPFPGARAMSKPSSMLTPGSWAGMQVGRAACRNGPTVLLAK